MAATGRGSLGAVVIVWLIGCGDIGSRLGRRLREQGETVHALSRSDRLIPDGVIWHPADLDRPDSLPRCSGQIIYTAPPPRQGRRDPRVRAWLQRAGDCDAMVYLSTSGVYGDQGGNWVDERCPPAPQTDRAHRRLDAERQLQAWAQRQNVRLAILRVPGIYGPGRLPRQRIEQGRPILAPDQAPWSNRIHAEDLTTACLLALAQGRGIYNISDGSPSSMSEYFTAVARHLGLPEPPRIDWDRASEEFSPQLLSFYRESRRMDITKARRELGFEPRYADLAQGLAAC